MNKRADGRLAGKYDAGARLRVDTRGNRYAYDAGGEAHIHPNGTSINRKRVAFSLVGVNGLCNLDDTLPEWLKEIE